jgi:hypothetical protein
VLFVFLFAGEYIIPESDPALQYDRQTGYVFPGRAKDWRGEPLYTKKMELADGASRHFTFIFTAFVMMQIMHMVCCRKYMTSSTYSLDLALTSHLLCFSSLFWVAKL